MVSDYLFKLFHARIADAKTGPAAAACVFPPQGIAVDLAVDCELLADVLAEAYHTPSMSAHFTSECLIRTSM
jgi:hypothetical protein